MSIASATPSTMERQVAEGRPTPKQAAPDAPQIADNEGQRGIPVLYVSPAHHYNDELAVVVSIYRNTLTGEPTGQYPPEYKLAALRLEHIRAQRHLHDLEAAEDFPLALPSSRPEVRGPSKGLRQASRRLSDPRLGLSIKL